jgi:hypothetical protein
MWAFSFSKDFEVRLARESRNCSGTHRGPTKVFSVSSGRILWAISFGRGGSTADVAGS